jgi:acetylornithine deacetylase/succinyl-diaminopimelate desuccinylase-like protein
MTEELRLASYAEAEADRIVATLFDWLRIPSISADPDRAGDVRASAEFCARLLRDAGLEHVMILEPPPAEDAPGAEDHDGLEGDEGPAGFEDGERIDDLEGAAGPEQADGAGGPEDADGAGGSEGADEGGGPKRAGVAGSPAGAAPLAGPAVYGDWLHAGPDAPTVLVYGHHDVQPVDPLELWTSPPFSPVIVDGECRARGAVDDKGQTLYQIEAARGLLAANGVLPVNLKFIIEGEEEIGSPHFEGLLAREARRLACDVIVVSDTDMLAPDVPSITVGMRGLVAFDVDVVTSTTDLHSGTWGGTVPNAALVAAQLAAALHDADGKVTLPRFYDRVRPLSPAEQGSLAAQPFDKGVFMSQAGVRALVGEVGFSPIERTTVRPTAEVVGLTGGYHGPGIKTIVPATANLKVALRLVPDQRPAEVTTAFREWLATHVPSGVAVTVTAEGAVAPALTPVDHPAMGALVRAIERVWGKAPLFTRTGGSGPEEALGRLLAAPVLFLGIGLPDDRYHAPNERMVMAQFWKGLLAAGELLVELGG